MAAFSILYSNPLDINLINTDSVPGMLERQICCCRHWEYSNEKDSLCFCTYGAYILEGEVGGGWERQKPGRLLL